jgi:hypothetical protein
MSLATSVKLNAKKLGRDDEADEPDLKGWAPRQTWSCARTMGELSHVRGGQRHSLRCSSTCARHKRHNAYDMTATESTAREPHHAV